jgi:lysophospholipase L1-like esterase
VTRFPKWNLTFRNVGIGGDRSTGGNNRFKRDVLAHNATALTVDFGMNDGNYKAFEEKTFDVYMKGLQGIADQAKAANVRVAWVTPQPCERGPEDKGYNDTLEKFSELGVKEVAKKNDGLFVDQFRPYYAVVKKAREADPMTKTIMGGDAVHPGPPGQAVMAASILKGMNFPRLVCRAEINLVTNLTPAVKFVNCSGKVKLADGGFTLTRTDHVLPFFPGEAKNILKFTPLLEEMNEYVLQVDGLAPGKWEVQIGPKSTVEFTADELKKGVNLAAAVLASGPVADNVKKVTAAVAEKNKYFHDQIFRGVVLAGAKSAIFKDVDAKDREAARKTAYEERMKKMPEFDAAVRRALETALNTEYVITIRPAKK